MAEQWYALADRLSRRVFSPASHQLPVAATPREIAYHEAGHVVVLELSGRRCTGATIDSERAGCGFSGRVFLTDGVHESRSGKETPFDKPQFVDERVHLCMFAAAAYAGRQAEYLRAGADPDGWLDEDSPDDRDAAFFLSLGFGRMLGSAPRGGCQRLARQMLIENWRVVRRVAMALLVHKTLDAAQIKRLMQADPSRRWVHNSGSAGRGAPHHLLSHW